MLPKQALSTFVVRIGLLEFAWSTCFAIRTSGQHLLQGSGAVPEAIGRPHAWSTPCSLWRTARRPGAATASRACGRPPLPGGDGHGERRPNPARPLQPFAHGQGRGGAGLPQPPAVSAWTRCSASCVRSPLMRSGASPTTLGSSSPPPRGSRSQEGNRAPRSTRPGRPDSDRAVSFHSPSSVTWRAL